MLSSIIIVVAQLLEKEVHAKELVDFLQVGGEGLLRKGYWLCIVFMF